MIATTANLHHSLLATVSWDNCLRVYTTCTATPPVPLVANNEHSCPFTGVTYDPNSHQVGLSF